MKKHQLFTRVPYYLLSVLLFGAVLVAPSVSAAASDYTWTDASTTDTATHGLTWHSLATSASGQHLLAGLYNDDVWTSSDYGATWTNTTTANPSMHGYNWQAAASDSSGQHLVLAAYNGDLWTSSDYGAHWTDVSTGHTALTGKTWFSVASDSTGQNLVAGVLNGDIFTSSDYGATWTDRTASGSAHLRYWQAITSSSTGQYLAGIVRDGDIYTSNDHGVTWTDVSTSTALNTGGLTWWDLNANATGQRLTALTHNGDIYTSQDYGATWTNISDTDTATHGLNWNNVTVSGTGQYQAATANNNGVWISNDYGSSWTKSAGTNGLNWASVRLSADGRHIVSQIGSDDTWSGINPDIQDSATVPNSDDANGDSQPDSYQGNVRGSISPVTNHYALVQADTNCAVTDQSIESATSETTQDSGYSYPAGLMNFSVQGCGAAGFTTTVTQYYYGVSGSNFILRKYNPNTKQYATINGATITQTTIGGQNVIKAVYQVTDGGSLDEDGVANGVIVDPTGLAVSLSTASSLAPDTGYGKAPGSNMLGTTIASILAISTGTGLYLLNRREHNHK